MQRLTYQCHTIQYGYDSHTASTVKTAVPKNISCLCTCPFTKGGQLPSKTCSELVANSSSYYHTYCERTEVKKVEHVGSNQAQGKSTHRKNKQWRKKSKPIHQPETSRMLRLHQSTVIKKIENCAVHVSLRDCGGKAC